jgi:predicted phage-related endonuclease
MKKTTTNINTVLKELKEYADMQAQLKAEIEALQEEAKQYMKDNGLDEVISDTGIKATYREVISKRFDSTAFKKDFSDIYAEYQKATSSMRFTLN